MRIGILTAFLLAALPAAAEPAAPGAALGYAPATQASPPSWEASSWKASSWEARFGLGATRPGGRDGPLANLGGELLSPRLVAPTDRLSAALIPRFHIGTSLTLNGRRYGYAGVTWTLDLSRTVFVEASLGAAIGEGRGPAALPLGRFDSHCRAAARGGAALGMRLSDRWSLVATLERYEAAGCGDSSGSGPASFGARLGYTF